ncbi:MAG: hypothetical protein MUC36_21440 [Planctomycetes bacterium]|jgi:hypothetical protein|nr:hypothetical protein [Planctomycetota bacterium]
MRRQQNLGAAVARTGALSMTVLLGACAVAPALGWQADLERQIGSSLVRGDAEARPALPIDADPVPGDVVEFAILLQQGERTKKWRIAVTVDAVRTVRGFSRRAIPDFEDRVQPGEERRKRMQQAQADFMARHVELEDMFTDLRLARLRVEAFDADGKALGDVDTDADSHAEVLVSQLRAGLLPACRAGHRQREVMRGRVALGKAAPMLTLADDAHDDVGEVARGVALCTDLFKILQSNPVTRQILREVLELPSLWSLLTNWGVRVTFEVDFFAAERVDPASVPGESRELWSVPLMLLLNDQPGFVARVVIGPGGAPDGATAGIHGVIAQHPVDEQRRVVVRMLSTRQGPREAGR